MNEVFQVNPSAPHSPKDKDELYSRNPKMVTYGIEAFSFLAPNIWSRVPEEIEHCKSLDSFLKI